MQQDKQNHSDVKRIFLSIFKVVVIVFILDFAIGKGLEYLYFKQESGLEAAATYTVKSMDEEVIIFGSSRANHHYVPEIISDSLGMSCFNAGRDGQYTFYYEAMIASALKRYKPKLIILELNSLELLFSQDSYDRISALLPYYDQNSVIQDIVRLKSSFEPYKLISKIYPYNGRFLTIIQNSLKSPSHSDGYKPINRSMEDPKMDTMDVLEREFDIEQFRSLERIVDMCKEREVPLIVVTSPALIVGNDPEKNNKIIELSEQFGFVYYDFAYDPYFMSNKSLFADPLHLNDEGAREFTRRLIPRIR